MLIVATTPTMTTGAFGTIAADGTFVAQAPGATIAGTVDAATTSVNGTIAVPNQAPIAFAGVASTTARTDRLINLSSRVRISPAAGRALITGFVIGGTEPKQILIRGIGPALASFGVQGVLANPRIQIHRGSELIAENDDWSTANAAALAGAFARIGAFSLAADSRDAALLTTLPPGAYTAQILDAPAGAGGGTGVVLAEIYDASVNPPAEPQRLVNLSTRGTAEPGDGVLIGGFVVTGNVPKRVLIRGIGPALAAFGVGDALVDPRLRIYRGATLIAENDNWSAGTPADTAALVESMRGTGAFALAAGSRDAALVLALAPGTYTAQVDAANGTATGVALVEIYEIPE